MAPTTNQQLAERLDGLRGLVESQYKERSRQWDNISEQLKLMNGRQRDNTAWISANREAIGSLRTRVDYAIDVAREDVKRKATIVGIISSVEALGAFIAALLTRP